MILRWLAKLFSIIVHLVYLGAVFYFLKPVFSWYLGISPILGVDFYNSVTNVSNLKNNFILPFFGYKDIWFGGYPLYRDFVSLHYYPMMVLANLYGLVRGIQLYVLLSLFLLAAFSYLLYYQVAKSRIFALSLAFLVSYSVNIYGSATWGGSLPYFTTQFVLPLVLLLIYKYVETSNKQWYLAAILCTSLGILGHPLPVMAFVIPAVAIIILCRLRTNKKGFFNNLLAKVKNIVFFVLGALVIALPVTHEQVLFTISSLLRNGPAAFFVYFQIAPSTPLVGQSAKTGTNELAKFYQGLPSLLYSQTNSWLFVLGAVGLALFLATYILVRKKRVLGRVVAPILICLYTVVHPILNANGFSFFSQGWYRAFWPFPVTLALLTAALWGEFFGLIRAKLSKFKVLPFLDLSHVPFFLLFVISAYLGYTFFDMEAKTTIEAIESKAEYSSAHPQALNIRTGREEQEELKNELLPSFIDANDKNKRLYEADALVNIWWNTFYKVPLARGYTDPPIATSQRGGLYWLDLAIANDSLVNELKISEAKALNHSLFLIDWNGIYYYEGGRQGISSSPPPSSYLLQNDVFDEVEEVIAYGAVLKWLTASGKPELHLDIPQYLKYYKVKDEYTSPVLYGSKSPAILVFSDFPGYEDLMRVLGASNFNSKFLVAVNAGRYVDALTYEEMAHFDGAILHNFSYHNRGKAMELLSKFVSEGGKVFLDTGRENKESSSDNLPDLFPALSTTYGPLGKDWDWEVGQDEITRGVNFSSFDPPVYSGDEWKLSFVEDEAKLRHGVKTILKHKNKPILTKMPYGKGEVYWSGMNLLYHINQYGNEEEIELFTNLLKTLVPIRKSEIYTGEAKWLRPEKVMFSASEAEGIRGVIFKEQLYEGWKARLISDKGKLGRIYPVGPTYPGFMYIPLVNTGTFELEISYSGQREAYLVYGFSLVMIIIVLEGIIFRGNLFGRRVGRLAEAWRRKMGGWWEREEE